VLPTAPLPVRVKLDADRDSTPFITDVRLAKPSSAPAPPSPPQNDPSETGRCGPAS
jgi:hypothetical protein